MFRNNFHPYYEWTPLRISVFHFTRVVGRKSLNSHQAFTLNLLYTSAPLTRCAVCVRRVFGPWLINFSRTWGEQRTPGAAWKGQPMHGKDTRHIQFSLCSHTNPTNFGLRRTVYKPFADGAVQVCSPIHTYAHLVCKQFASSLWTIWRARVYKGLDIHSYLNKMWMVTCLSDKWSVLPYLFGLFYIFIVLCRVTLHHITSCCIESHHMASCRGSMIRFI